MWVFHDMIASQAAVSFCWILNRLEVVGYGNYWKKDQDQDSQCDRLRKAVATFWRGAHDRPDDHGRGDGPRKIKG